MLVSLLLTASLAATVMLGLLLLVRKLFQKRLSPRFIQGLWLLVLIKLLVPVAPQSSVSLFNLLPQELHQKSTQWDGPFGPGSPPKSLLPSSGAEQPLPDPVTNRAEAPQAAAGQPAAQETSSGNGRPEWSWLAIGSLVWLGGLLVFSVSYLLSAWTFRRTMLTSRRPAGGEILSIVQACREKLGIRSPLPVYVTSELSSPCLYGLTKPAIYMPEDIAAVVDSRQLTHVLLHELTHYKRKDLWIHALWTLSLGIHWFNPAVWLAVRTMKADREVACDAGVLEVLGEREASSYGMTLLMLARFLTRRPSFQGNLSHFFETRSDMRRRITMIAKFKKGSYKLSAAAILLVLALSATMLTSASETARSSNADAGTSSGAEKAGSSSLNITRLNDWAKWFANLERANEYAGFTYQVPDYLPPGYQLQNAEVLEHYVNRTDNLAYLTFVSDFGKETETIFELVASKGNLLKTHDLVWGTGNIAPWTWGAPLAVTYRHDEATRGGVQGTLVTQTQGYEQHAPEIAKSFVWQNDGVWYAINYYSENHTLKEGTPLHRRNLSEEELAKVVASFTYPQQLQHVRYDGQGNSFPLYGKADLAQAKDILGFPVKLPSALANTPLKLSDSILLRAGDQNTGFSFRPHADSLLNSYRLMEEAEGIDLNDELTLYQSSTPLFDVTKLSPVRTLEINGVELSAYADPDHVYMSPTYTSDSSLGSEKFRSMTYYLWKQDDVYYTAVFMGMDNDQEAPLRALVLAPAQ